MYINEELLHRISNERLLRYNANCTDMIIKLNEKLKKENLSEIDKKIIIESIKELKYLKEVYIKEFSRRGN